MEKRSFLKLTALAMALTSLLGSSFAQHKYSLKDIIDLYNQNSLELKISQIDADNAASRKKTAGAWENPSLRYAQEGINTGTPASPLSGREFQLTLEQRIPLSGRPGLKSKRAAKDIRIAQQEYQSLYRTGLSAIKSLFFEIQALAGNLEILAVMKHKIEELSTAVDENYKRGEVSGIDTARIQMVLKDIDLERYNIGIALDLYKRELITRLDLAAEPSQIEFKEPYHPYVIGESKETLLQSLIDSNPRIQMLINEQEREEIQLSLEKRRNFPDLTAAGGYKREDFFDTYSFAFSLNIPLLNRHGGEIEVARNNIRKIDLRQRLVTKELVQVFDRELQKHLRSKELLRLFRTRYLSQADKLENATLEAYRGGEVGMFVLVDALQSVLETRLEYIDLVLQNNIAIFNIEKMINREIVLEQN